MNRCLSERERKKCRGVGKGEKEGRRGEKGRGEGQGGEGREERREERERHEGMGGVGGGPPEKDWRTGKWRSRMSRLP